MNRCIHCFCLSVICCFAGCGNGTSAEDTPDAAVLSVPAVSVSVSELTATVQWSIAQSVQGVRFTYEFYRDGVSTPALTATTRLNSLKFDLEAGVLYKFRIQAVAPAGSFAYKNSEFSEFVSISSSMLASPVANLAGKSATGATLTWSKVEGAAGYGYELFAGEASSAVKSGETIAAEILFDGLESATVYRFRVKALAAAGGVDSGFSEEVSFETDRTSVEPDEELGLPVAGENDGVLRAFPGAEGGGMYTTGGRGGKVYHVTNLNNSGTGSLRAAVEASGKRIVVFDVAGTIALQKGLEIKNGDLTIAGQTAPGDGVCLRNYPVTVKADNVIIRYLRFRLGDQNVNDGDDTIWGRYRQNILLDHCSMSWCIDECASFYANRNFTMQWCLLGESLHNSGHSKGSHGYGGIWGGAPASFHHNILAHHDSRNPRFDEPNAYDFTGLINGVTTNYKGESGFSNDDRKIDYRNNVVYNFCNFGAYGGEGAQVNFVGNYYKWGPASVDGLGRTISTSGSEGTDNGKRREWFYQVDCAYTTGGKTYDAGPTAVYYRGNKLDTSISDPSKGDAVTADNAKGFTTKNASTSALGEAEWLQRPLAIAAGGRGCYVTEHSAEEALARTVAYAGASLSRDAVDKRLADDVQNGKANVPAGSNGSLNGIIDRPSDTASASAAFGAVDADGYPRLTASDEQIARASKDTDADGIPDYYEDLLGLDRNDPSDAAALTLDPQGIYPNIEVYLHYLVKDITAAQTAGGSYTALN